MSAEERLAIIVERRDLIREWLEEQPRHPRAEQKHLEPGSSEQTYWHHGYQSALDDMIRLLTL
jgi:hypothetical protein